MVDTWEESLTEWSEEREEQVEEMARDPSFLSGYIDNVYIAWWDRDADYAAYLVEKMIERFAEFYATRADLPEGYIKPLAEFYKVWYAVRVMDKYGIDDLYKRWVEGRDMSLFFAGMGIHMRVFGEVLDTRRIAKYWTDFRRASGWYISMTPSELNQVGAVVAKGYMEGRDVREVAEAVANITGRSPRSLYFNLYYMSKAVRDYDADYGKYLGDVARALSKLRRGG